MKLIPTRILQRYTTWRSVHVLLVGCIIVPALTAAFAFAWPVRNTIRITNGSPETTPVDGSNFEEWLHSQGLSNHASPVPIRSGLFKSASRLRRAPEDKTVERIKSQLKLRSLMSLYDAPIAFVLVEGKGMRPCRIGGTITDGVEVLDIDLEQNRMDIEITGKKATLTIK